MGDKPKPHIDKLCNTTYAVDFVKKFSADCAKLASQIDVPMENILGLAAQESQWGTGRIAVTYNNYFSMHAPAPGQSGVVAAQGDPKVKVATFKSFIDGGQSFIDRFGVKVRGTSDPTQFAQGLVDCGFNSGDAKTGGRSDFVPYLAGIIRNVIVRLGCP